MKNTTLCYIENEKGEYLMLHRVKKQNDLNHDKWIGVFFAISPIIALVARMKKGYWLALVFAEIYSFAGLFASMSRQLKTVYPMTAVFNISGYYDASMVQVFIGIIVLLACVVLTLFILKGLNRKAKY